MVALTQCKTIHSYRMTIGLVDANYLFSMFRGRIILCAPEDVACSENHNCSIICERCTFPLCFECNTKSRQKAEAQCRIPEALANDNFVGYVSSTIYKYKVRWIECVAASPVFTSLITYYVEGDRGHVLGERQHVPLSTGETESVRGFL